MVGFVDAPGVSAGCAATGGAVGVAGGSADAGRGARTSGAVGGLAWTGGSTGGIATGATAALDEKGVVLATALGGLARVLAAVTSTPRQVGHDPIIGRRRKIARRDLPRLGIIRGRRHRGPGIGRRRYLRAPETCARREDCERNPSRTRTQPFDEHAHRPAYPRPTRMHPLVRLAADLSSATCAGAAGNLPWGAPTWVTRRLLRGFRFPVRFPSSFGRASNARCRACGPFATFGRGNARARTGSSRLRSPRVSSRRRSRRSI